jgi:hypothetical protein
MGCNLAGERAQMDKRAAKGKTASPLGRAFAWQRNTAANQGRLGTARLLQRRHRVGSIVGNRLHRRQAGFNHQREFQMLGYSRYAQAHA